MPEMWIVAGPNGSGKTTTVLALEDEGIFQPPAFRLNADAWLAALSDEDRARYPNPQLAAAQITDAAVDSQIAAGEDFLVETVLSSEKYLERVRVAKAAGYRLTLVYIVLADPQLNILRVRHRVEQGGHDVPRDKIIERYYRSIEMLGAFIPYIDHLLIYDNSELFGWKLLLDCRSSADGGIRAEYGSLDGIENIPPLYATLQRAGLIGENGELAS